MHCLVLCIVPHVQPFDFMQNFQHLGEVLVPHKRGNNPDVPSPPKVSEASYRIYRQTSATHLNRDQKHYLAQQGYESHLE